MSRPASSKNFKANICDSCFSCHLRNSSSPFSFGDFIFCIISVTFSILSLRFSLLYHSLSSAMSLSEAFPARPLTLHEGFCRLPISCVGNNGSVILQATSLLPGFQFFLLQCAAAQAQEAY